MNYGTPAAPAAGGKSEKAQAETYCGECPVHFSPAFFMNSRIAPAPNGAGACFCPVSAIPPDMRAAAWSFVPQPAVYGII